MLLTDQYEGNVLVTQHTRLHFTLVLNVLHPGTPAKRRGLQADTTTSKELFPVGEGKPTNCLIGLCKNFTYNHFSSFELHDYAKARNRE